MFPFYSSVCATSPEKGVLVYPRYFSSRSTHVKTRKSSCVNARGIPTATFQVLHLLSEVGYPPPSGTPPPPMARSNRKGGYPRWGIPPSGYPPARSNRGYPRWGTRRSGYPPPQLAGPGRLPPPRQVWIDKQSETITSHLVLRTRSVKMSLIQSRLGVFQLAGSVLQFAVNSL